MSKSGTINSNHMISNRIDAARKKTSSENIQLTLMIKYLENFEEFALIRIFLQTFKEKWEENGQAKKLLKIIFYHSIICGISIPYFLFNNKLKAIKAYCAKAAKSDIHGSNKKCKNHESQVIAETFGSFQEFCYKISENILAPRKVEN